MILISLQKAKAIWLRLSDLKPISRHYLTMRKIWLWCAKGRTYTNTSRTRFTGSCIIECPFKATLTRTLIGWGLEVKDPTYNYAAAINLIALL
jgi:hypothetical protein